MSETNWLPALVVLALGAGLALAFLLAGRKRSAAPPRDPKLEDLDQRVQILLDQLRELEIERHQMGDAYAAEKGRLEAAAAAALKERDRFAKTRASARGRGGDAAPAPAPSSTRYPQLKGALWGAGVVLFFVAVAFVLTREQRERSDGAITGRSPPGAEAMRQPNADPGFERAVTRAKENPRDVENASLVTHELLRRERYDEAEEITRRALAGDPFHVELRIHQVVLRATRGELPAAIQQLERLARYPDAYEALLFRGALAMQVGNSEVALESFERYLAEAPPDQHPPQLASAISILRQKVNAPK
jgi:tetratricopeptide (TPR) repeat protein